MSRYTPALVTLALLMASAPSVSDGVFLLPAGYPASGDPRSHAPDITEPQQKALIVHNDGVEELVLQVSFKGSASRRHGRRDRLLVWRQQDTLAVRHDWRCPPGCWRRPP